MDASSSQGRRRAAEREWQLAPLAAKPEPPAASPARIERVYKRFWWPHPYARERGLLWRKVVVGYRYYDARGRQLYVQP